MKTILYILLGILLGSLTIKLGISTINALISLCIIKTLFGCLFTYGCGLLSLKCFQNA